MEPDPEKIKAAVAAMCEEWRELAPLVKKADDAAQTEDERAEAGAERGRLLEEFFDRHKVALNAPDSPLPKEDLEVLRRKAAELRAANAKIAAMEEKLLHLAADDAEAQADLAVATLNVLAGLEALTPEDWEKMEAVQRANVWDTLMQLREVREQLLAELPVERRRVWEAR